MTLYYRKDHSFQIEEGSQTKETHPADPHSLTPKTHTHTTTMPSANATASKKRTSEKDDFEALRMYILDCPLFVDTEKNPAVMAALKGLENGLKSMERDTKLQKKFAQSASVKEPPDSATSKTNPGSGDPSDEWETVAAACDDRRSSPQNRGDDPEDDDEVEIVDMNEKEGDSSYLGRQLSESAIVSIAENQTRVRSPVAAIALILHGAMRSNLLAFDCTGVPDDSKAKSNGFAAPIRSLPKNTFLPKDWDKEASSSDSPKQSVTLRYRKAGMGSVLLKVELLSSNTAESPIKELSVNLVPIGSQEPPNQPLVFPIDSHVNMDSWAAATRASNFGIQPVLHYKGLPALLTLFAKAFDLGSVSDGHSDSTGQQQNSYVPVTQPVCDKSNSTSRNGFAPPVVSGPARVYDERNPNIGTAFPPQRPTYVGDFSGDLTDPLRVLGSGRPGNLMPGNLMGPNHPMFGSQNVGGIGDGSGFGMRPRFDPFGPPGGPQQVYPPDGTDDRPRPGQRRQPGGNPNADHLRPPNSLGNNGMFS